MKKNVTTEELEIEVTKTWPMGNLKEVKVHRQGHVVYDDIELTPKQAEQLYWALGDILGMNNAKVEAKKEYIS